MAKSKINSITADFRITKEDGAKSLLQLINEENPQPIPDDKKIKSFYFLVSGAGSDLITTSESPVRPGFQMVVKTGQVAFFPLSPEALPKDLRAVDLLDGAFMSTDGVCDFFVHIELV